MTPRERAARSLELIGCPRIYDNESRVAYSYGGMIELMADAIRDAHNAAIDQAALLAHGYQKEKILELKV
jgi:hypothetical protein